MRPFYLMPVVLLLAVGCERSATDPAAVDEPAELVEQTSSFSGAEAYRQACARCHDEGLDGAPRTDDAEAWAGRSWLWEAVLFEHAKNGYNNMPPKGGYASLPDDLVEKAAEYMLSRTSKVPPSD